MQDPLESSKQFLHLLDGVSAEEQETDIRSLRSLEEALRSSQLRTLRMQWPLLDHAQREAFLKKSLPSLVGPRVAEVSSHILVTNGFEALSEFIKHYAQFREQYQLGVEASVTSAYPLSAEQLTRIKAYLSSLAKQSIILHESIDPVLQGGFRLKLKDWIYDGSLRGRLQNLFQHLTS